MALEEQILVRYAYVWKPQAIAIPLLLIALLDLPYGYYIFLRIICCPSFIWIGIYAIDNSDSYKLFILIPYRLLSYTSFLIAIIYNPIFRIHMNREMWSSMNIASIVVAAISMIALRGKMIDGIDRDVNNVTKFNSQEKTTNNISISEAWGKCKISLDFNMKENIGKMDFIHSFCWLVITGITFFLSKSTKDNFITYSRIYNSIYPINKTMCDKRVVFIMSSICAITMNDYGDYRPAYEKYCLNKKNFFIPPSLGSSGVQFAFKPNPGECTFHEYESLQKEFTASGLFMQSCRNANKILGKKDGIAGNMALYFPYDEIESHLNELDFSDSADNKKDEFINFIYSQRKILSSKRNDVHIQADPFLFVFEKSSKKFKI